MSLGLRADPTNTSAVISVAGTDQVVITNAGNVTANTFTGALTGNATTATKLSTATVGTAPSYSARAWVNFDGTRNAAGAVDATNTNRFIYASGNVTNVLRIQAGAYNVFFSTPMPDTNYAFSLSAHHVEGLTPSIGCSAHTRVVASIGVFTYLSYTNNVYTDLISTSVVIYR